MSRDALLTLVSVIVGILTSMLFFFLSIRRARRRTWHAAKARIVADLSQSLGQDVVPARQAVWATIRSVCREFELTEPHAVTYDEALEELLRHVTADPFLDAERRRRLQDALLGLQQPETPIVHEILPFERGSKPSVVGVGTGHGSETDDVATEIDGMSAAVPRANQFGRELSYLARALNEMGWRRITMSLAVGMAVALIVNKPDRFFLAIVDLITDLLDLLLRR